MTERTCAEFSDRLAAREPVPGGGGASAYVGALGTALCTMACRFIEGRPACAAHDPTCSRAELMSSISAASEDPAVHGILVFRPLPASLDVAVHARPSLPRRTSTWASPGTTTPAGSWTTSTLTSLSPSLVP